MRRRVAILLALSLVMAVSLAGSALANDGTVSILAVWGGAEEAAFLKMLEPFEAATGIEVLYEGTRDLPTVLRTRIAAGNPPDIVALSGPGMLKDYASSGDLVDLRDVLDMQQFHEDYSDAWTDLASHNGGLYGVFISADIKSLIWYSPKEFAARSYEVPETWAELVALSELIADDGGIPWSIGLEAGAASGWPATDWIEDIMLRTAGPKGYDKWVDHEISWTSPEVRRAFELFGQIARDPKMVYGGIPSVLMTNFGDSANPLFTDPPQALMHRQASFIVSFIKGANPDLVPGVDYDFFLFPPIDEEWGNPILGAADMLSMAKDTPEARALMRYVATPGAQALWVSELGKLGVNKRINPSIYPDDLTREMAQALVSASDFRFDGSDSMPAAIGSGAFWTSILDYVRDGDLDTVLTQLEQAAADAY